MDGKGRGSCGREEGGGGEAKDFHVETRGGGRSAGGKAEWTRKTGDSDIVSGGCSRRVRFESDPHLLAAFSCLVSYACVHSAAVKIESRISNACLR